MIKWVLTTKMAKDPWHKGRIGKIKNSPAADALRGAAGRTAEFLGLVPPRDEFEAQPNEHGPAVQQSRKANFNESVGQHLPILASDSEKLDTFARRGVGLGSEGNVSSIVNGIKYRGEKAARKPEGY